MTFHVPSADRQTTGAHSLESHPGKNEADPYANFLNNTIKTGGDDQDKNAPSKDLKGWINIEGKLSSSNDGKHSVTVHDLNSVAATDELDSAKGFRLKKFDQSQTNRDTTGRANVKASFEITP